MTMTHLRSSQAAHEAGKRADQTGQPEDHIQAAIAHMQAASAKRSVNLESEAAEHESEARRYRAAAKGVKDGVKPAENRSTLGKAEPNKKRGEGEWKRLNMQFGFPRSIQPVSHGQYEIIHQQKTDKIQNPKHLLRYHDDAPNKAGEDMGSYNDEEAAKRKASEHHVNRTKKSECVTEQVPGPLHKCRLPKVAVGLGKAKRDLGYGSVGSKGQLLDDQNMPTTEPPKKPSGQVQVHGGEMARAGDHLDNFGERTRIMKISRDGRSVDVAVPKQDRFGKEYLDKPRVMHVSGLAHMRLMKAELPQVIRVERHVKRLDWGDGETECLRVTVLGKSSFDDRGMDPGEKFDDYARRHAQRWAVERMGLEPDRADAYAQHYVTTHPEGIDEHGNSVDHPTVYRQWQEESAPEPEPAPAQAPPPKVKRSRAKLPAVTPGRVTWMHGQRPK